jgi:hypothetical protein
LYWMQFSLHSWGQYIVDQSGGRSRWSAASWSWYFSGFSELDWYSSLGRQLTSSTTLIVAHGFHRVSKHLNFCLTGKSKHFNFHSSIKMFQCPVEPISNNWFGSRGLYSQGTNGCRTSSTPWASGPGPGSKELGSEQWLQTVIENTSPAWSRKSGSVNSKI